MNIMNVDPNKVYWCIQPSIESANYMQCDPRQPWQGKADIQHRPGGTVVVLHSWNGKELNCDSNASAIINRPEQQLFETEDAAADAYIDAMLQHIKWLADGLSHEIDQLKIYKEKRNHDKLR